MFECKTNQSGFNTIKASLIQLRRMCKDAEEKADCNKPEAMSMFIRDVDHFAKMIEDQADIFAGNRRIKPPVKQPWHRLVLGYIFPLTRMY